jgi:hypothetical protein
MRFATGLIGMAARAGALALLAVSLATPGAASAQGTSAGAPADPAKKGRAAICAGAYNAYAMHADFVVGAAFKSRRDRLMETFGIDRQELSRLRPPSRASAGAMMGMPQNLALGGEVEQAAKCDEEFGFAPVTTLVKGSFYIPSTFHLHCAASFLLASSAWPQERDAYLMRAQMVVDQHLAAVPDLDRAETEQRVRESAQTLANRLNNKEIHPDAFKADLVACAREHGVEKPSAAAQPARSPQALYEEGRQMLGTNKAEGLRLILQACDGGHLDACVGYAQLGGPEGRSVDTDKAIAFALGKACTLGSGLSCYDVAYSLDPATMLGGFVRELRSGTDAKTFYERACKEHKINDACMSLMAME